MCFPSRCGSQPLPPKKKDNAGANDGDGDGDDDDDTHTCGCLKIMLTMMGVEAHSADRSWYCHDDGKTSDWSDGTDVDDKKSKG